MVWYLPHATRPRGRSSVAVVTQRWISEGRILPIGRRPKIGDEVLVEVGPVGGQGGGLDLLGGQPDGLDVLGEGDLAAGVVVPGAVADLGFFPVGGAFGGAAGGVGAGGALPAFGVAVAGDEPL